MARILIIDDEPELRGMMCQLLRNESHTVTETDDGRRAMTWLTHEPFDLVITDILMPEMDGLEIIQAIHRMKPALPILAVSGGGRSPAGLYLAVADKLGADQVLGKPFAPAKFLAVVRSLLGGIPEPN